MRKAAVSWMLGTGGDEVNVTPDKSSPLHPGGIGVELGQRI